MKSRPTKEEQAVVKAAVNWAENGPDQGICADTKCAVCKLSRAVAKLQKAKKRSRKS